MDRQLQNLDHWKVIGEQKLYRELSFTSFKQAVQFVNLVAEYAEEVNHHPTITLKYRKVIIDVTTWEEKQLTSKDIQLAKEIDRIYERFSNDYKL